MRLGYDISPITSRRTGIGNYCLHLLRALLETLPGDEIVGLAVGRRSPQLDSLPMPLSYRRVPVPARLMYRVWNGLHAPSVESLLGKMDVFHATNFFLPPIRRARKVLSVPDASFKVVPALCSPKVVGPFSEGVARFIRQADVVLTISESSKRDIVKHFGAPPEKVRVTLIAADERLKALDRQSASATIADVFGIRSPYLLFVSTLEPRKNVEAVVRAFDRLSGSIPHALVLVGGLGWNTGPILESIDRSQSRDRIHRVGFVDNKLLAALYSAADVFVFPSFYEGFGLPVLEAMQCGCPVVTANNSSLPEVGGDAALYVNAEDDESLSSALLRVLGDEALRRTMVERGLSQAKRFSWRACAEATAAAYRG